MRSLLLAALSLPTLVSAQTPAPTAVLDAHTFNTDGHPTQAIWTPDGQYVLVTVTHEQRLGSGIEVFHVEGDKLKRVAFNPLGAEPAEGILLIPNTRTLAVGLSDAGVAFLPLDTTLTGRAAAHIIPQGDHPGSGSLAVTPDGKTLFVANRTLRGGSVGVIALRRDPKGQFAPQPIAQIPAPRSTPGIAISPDGSRLFAVAEVLPEHWSERMPGHDNPDLQHGKCSPVPEATPNPSGGLYVFDAAAAATPPTDYSAQHNRDAILNLTNAGCSPTRDTVSSDGRTVYVTAQGDDNVLVFDAAALESDPDHALLRSIPTAGEAPIGLALFDHDRKLLVANSNRFTIGPCSATVIDLATNPSDPKVIQTIKTGDLPRNVTASPDGRALLLTVYLADEIVLLTMK